MTYYKPFLVAISSITLAIPTISNANEDYFYSGVKAGWTNYQDACSDDVIKCNNDTLGYGTFIGYKTLDWLSVEGGLTDYGNPDAHYSYSDVKASMWGVDAALKLDQKLSDNFGIYAKAGATWLSIDKTITKANGFQQELSSHKWRPLIGLGIEYSLNENWQVRSEYQFVDGIGSSEVLKADLHYTSLGIVYKFTSPKNPEAIPLPQEVSKSDTIKNPTMVEVTLSADSNFDFDSAQLKKPQALSNIISTLKSDSKLSVVIIGHTDNVGSEKYNKKLSLNRAIAVSDYLVAKGIEINRITTQGKGKLEPIADNSISDGRSKNRRVDITIY